MAADPAMTEAAWSHRIPLSAAGRGPTQISLEPDEAARRRIARLLDLAELSSLRAEIGVRPWLDGAEIEAEWSAQIVQTCGVSLDPLPSAPAGHFVVRVVPEGSPNAPAQTSEVEVDPDAPDPPDVAENDDIDLAGYVVEHLALEIDPFPRKPGVAFEPLKDETGPSPFAVLRRLQQPPKA
jgi:hypothetical protein